LKQDDIKKDLPGVTRRQFLYNISRSSYEKRWGKDYSRPGFWDDVLAFLYRILPKFGPLRVLTFRTPTPQTEKLFEESFNVTLDRYRVLLASLRASGEVALPNDNFDVGETTPWGKYRLGDEACGQLLDRLAENDFVDAPPLLRADLLQFFASPDVPPSDKLSEKARTRLRADVQKLENAGVAPAITKNGNSQTSPQ
jgi:hypothetical protein